MFDHIAETLRDIQGLLADHGIDDQQNIHRVHIRRDGL